MVRLSEQRASGTSLELGFDRCKAGSVYNRSGRSVASTQDLDLIYVKFQT
jgi:hypothetical protein